MNRARPLVANAASGRQTKKAEQYERRQMEQLMADLDVLLSTATGVRIVCSLLERWSAWKSVFSSDALLMARMSGKQDIAHELMTLAEHAREDAIPNIMAERARRTRERAAVTGAPNARDANDQDDTSEEHDG